MSPGLRRGLAYGAVAGVALVGGILLRWHFGGPTAIHPQPSDQGGEAILALSLPDLEGRNQALSQWKGQVLVVNFWATWCEPCKKEIPELSKVHSKFRDEGVAIIGIALDEPEQVKAFVAEFEIPYPTLIAPISTMDVSRTVGNFRMALPFTAILDRSGRVAANHLGGLDQSRLEAIISPLI